MVENFPYASVDYFSKKFKPTDLSIQKEKIRKSEARHYRDEIEFLVILTGSGEIEINHTTFSVVQGDFIQLMPYHVTRLLISEKSPIELYRIRFSIGLLLLISTDKTRYLNAIKNIDKSIPIASLDEKARRQVEFLCESVYAEKQTTNENLDVLHISLVSYLSYFANKNQQVSLKEKSLERDSTWKTLEYIQIHHQEQVTLQMISKELAVDEQQIKNKLKELTGVSFYSLLNQVRIRNAVALFQFDDLSINQIGKICGYQTEAYFYKNFKNTMGVTPLNYRKGVTGESSLGNSYDAWEIAIYILENCRKGLSLDEVALIMNVSKKKLNHLLSTTFNVTFKELLTHFRVQIGKTFLVSLNLPVQEVAILVGFSDATTFIRNFKAVYGVTPKQIVKREK
ncbi:AraC family transcriptional regulator [Carnobacterium sp. TMP28]|uniref:AraC family transcriptional regulator n=1 Tax=Carnobacterium sp. TMP28 TaxID=3397060 RepID=UPI0039DF32AE